MPINAMMRATGNTKTRMQARLNDPVLKFFNCRKYNTIMMMETKIFRIVRLVCRFLFLKRKIVTKEINTLITVKTRMGIFSAAVSRK